MLQISAFILYFLSFQTAFVASLDNYFNEVCVSTLYNEFGPWAVSTIDCDTYDDESGWPVALDLKLNSLINFTGIHYNCSWSIPSDVETPFGVYAEIYSTDDDTPTTLNTIPGMDDADPILYPTQSTSAEVPRAALVVCHLCYYKDLNASMVGYDTSTTIKYNIIQTVSMSYTDEEENFGEKVASFFEGTTGIIIQVSISAVVLLTAIGTMIYKAHRRSILEQVGNNTGPITTNGGLWYSFGAGGE